MNLGRYVPVLLYNIRMGALISKTHLKGALIGKGEGLLEGGR